MDPAWGPHWGVPMPSPAHEWMVALLTDDPSRLDVLLRVVRPTGLPARFVVVDAAVHLVDAVELRPDALLVAPDTARWLALEVQLQVDDEKRTTWPCSPRTSPANTGPRATCW
ncbi:MAG: hypothetical protein U0325_05340 [Polyangiales bacterium]